MITMHCTYPDGTTAEARYGVALDDAIALYDPLFDYDDRSWDEVTEVDVPAFDLGGEG